MQGILEQKGSAGLIEAGPPGFAALLFSRTDPRDLARCSPDDLVRVAVSAYRHLAEPRVPGQSSIRLLDEEITGDDRLREITVLEVVNDNMPFLLELDAC